MKKLVFMSVTVCSFLFANSTCNVFSNVLQTRLANSKITMQSNGQTAYIENTNNCYLNTTNVYKDASNHGLVCDINGNGKKDSDESMADATGNLGASLNINYNFTVANSTALLTPVGISNENVVINSENENLSGDKYNLISQDYHYYNFSWSPDGDDIGVNQFDNILNTVTISNVNGKDVKIGEFTTNTYNSTNLDIDGIPENIEINKLISQGSNKFTTTLEASNKIDINTLQIARNNSNVTLKAPTVVIENLSQTNSGGGDSVIKIYADNIDIKNINLNQNAKIYIYPYTTDGNVTFHSDSISSSSSSTIFVSSGKYYTNSFSIPGTKDSSSIRAIDNNQKVNFYINGDFKPGNNPGINSAGNNGNFGVLDPVNFKMFIRGDLDSGNGGTTFNALVYVGGSTNLGTETYLQGALSSGNDITIGNKSKFYWKDSVANSNYGTCNYNKGNVIFGVFNVVEPTFNSSTDPIDENNSLNQIYTKIVNKQFPIKVIKLKDDNQTLENYTGVVRLDLINKPANQNECNNNVALSKNLVIFNNQSSEIKNLTYNKANKDVSFRVRYFDFTFPQSCINLANDIYNNAGSGTLTTDSRTCVSDLKTVTENSSYNIASCMSNVLTQSVSTWKSININNIKNVTKSKVISLMECIFGNAKSVCSRDDFAIRPYKYKILSINNKKLTAGKDINLTIKALDYNGNLINNFNFANAPVEINVTDAIGCKTGDFTPKQSSVNFINGEANLTFNYKDVGDLNATIKEYKNGNEYAAVDENDSVNSSGIKESDNILLIGEGNSTISRFYPDHFSLDGTTYQNFKNSNFTYISSDLNMSSVLDVNITAKNADGGITYNYNNKCYAKNFDINISYGNTPSKIKTILAEVNNNEKNITIPKLIDFNLSKNYFSTDDNGSAVFKIYVNFEKNYTTPVNEFNFTIKDINITDEDDINGTNNLDQNATFRYGRIDVQNVSGYSNELNTTYQYEYWSNDGWVVNKEHNSTDFGDINISKSYHPNINMSILSQNGKNILEGKEKIKISTSHAIPYSAKIHLSIPSWLWYHPLAKPYKDPNGGSNLDCLTHPCMNVNFQKESSGWGGIGTGNEAYKETNRTSDINASLKKINVNKSTLKKINW